MRWRTRIAALGLLLASCEVSNGVVPFEAAAGAGADSTRSDTTARAGAPPLGTRANTATAGSAGRNSSVPTSTMAGTRGASETAGMGGTAEAAGMNAMGEPGSTTGGNSMEMPGLPGMMTNPPEDRGTGTDCRPAEHNRASLLTVKLRWDETLGIVGGSGELHLWYLIRVRMNGESGVTETSPCGSQLPIMTTTPVAGSMKVLAEVPFGAYDSPMMPRFDGSITKAGSMLSIKPGVFLMGLRMSDVNGPWPPIEQTGQIIAADDDGDGKPGITAVPRSSPGFTLSPTSVLQLEYADQIYAAQRFEFRGMAQDEGCPDVTMGTATIHYYDNRVIGCHIQGGGDCVEADVTFINSARPLQRADSTAVWISKVLPMGATCSDVRAALPVPDR